MQIDANQCINICYFVGIKIKILPLFIVLNLLVVSNDFCDKNIVKFEFVFQLFFAIKISKFSIVIYTISIPSSIFKSTP